MISNWEKGVFAVIVDADDREALRHYIARGSLIELNDNTEVEKDSVLLHLKQRASCNCRMGSICKSNNCWKAGIISFEDIIPGVTVSEQFDELTGTSKLVVNEYIPSGYKPTIILATDDKEIIRYSLIQNFV